MANGRMSKQPVGLIAMCAFLSSVTMATTEEIAIACNLSEKHVRKTLSLWRSLGLVHKAGHIRREGIGGTQIIQWARGHAPDAKPLPREDASTIRRRRLRKLKTLYDTTIANKILRSRRQGGPSKIVRDGKTIYERGKPRGAQVVTK